ncbi:MAG: hypothetical protein OEO23_07025, partial [Gemmatimonadota bacterium]|nr:hypothetical protein [Gemmatimonadota bacterium]
HDEVERIHGPSAWLGLGTRGLGWSAAVVAVLAIWATVAGHVRARGRELGTRSALGAGPRALTRLIMGEAGRMGLAGVGTGLWGATALVGIVGPEGGTLFRGGLFFGVGSFFLLVTMLAAVPGAREAGRIQPAVALSSLE